MEALKAEAWSTDDQTLQYRVHLGLWTNWSRDQVLGQTLTISRQNGNLLIAFTAFFIAFVGSRFWRIACFGLHRYHSTNDPRGAIHHQRQIILRNTVSADSAIVLFSAMFWAWRHSSRLFLHVLPSFLAALFCLSAFTVAGGISSQISSSVGTEVLINGSACGIGRDGALHGPETAYRSQMAKSALNYVQQCYTNSTGLMDCNAYATKRLPTYVSYDSPCPFNKSICRTDSANIHLDTGFVDSHHHLGVNAPQNERILFRQIVQCAPLITNGYRMSYKNGSENYALYDYGPSLWSNDKPKFTYKVKSVQHQYSHQPGDRSDTNYLLVSFSSYAWNGSTGSLSSDFVPRDEIWRTDADTFLIFISGNGVIFAEPMNDTWYRAFDYDLMVGHPGDMAQTYRPTEAASPLACAEQFQFCFGNSKRCGPLGGFVDASAGAFELLGVSKEHVWDKNTELVPGTTANAAASRFSWFALILRYTVPSIADVFAYSGPDALASTQTLTGGIQTKLPLNQWHIDITHSWAMIMSFWQATFVEIARGPTDPELVANKLAPTDSAQRQMCSNQKIRSTAYTSFNFFALLFTYILGLVIVAISFSLEPLVDYLHRKWGHATHAHLEWTANSVLQLHRLMHDDGSEKALTWSHCTDLVPTTSAKVPLAALDITDPTHPKLNRATTATDTALVSETTPTLDGTEVGDTGDDSGTPTSPEIHTNEYCGGVTEVVQEQSPYMIESDTQSLPSYIAEFPDDEIITGLDTTTANEDTIRTVPSTQHQLQLRANSRSATA
ncbi:hypothetical protein F4802DRAFT_136956 [Xylaria palmicola]|nr:hypothetical protein F4802DRAFT_136956 [Xylaria palmicola]